MASAEARLSLDGSSLPIVARIEACADDMLVVGRSLPFLKIGTRVRDAAGRKGAISGVSLDVEDGVPYLRVELDYEAAAKPKRERRDATLGYEARGYEARPSTPPARPSAPPLDATNHDSTLHFSPAMAEGAVDPHGVTQAFPRPSFVPSLVPMPLPIPEPAAPSPRMRRGRYGAAAFLAAFVALLVAWLKPHLPL